MRKLLHRLGLRRLKVNPFPGNPKKLKEWLVKQADWIKHLNKLHIRAEKNDIDMAFCDAAHFVYGKFCSYLWSDEPVYKATGSGRHRLNVYGAYDPITGRVLTNYGEGNIDAKYIVTFMQWLRNNHYKDHHRKLHLMMDNARYQHCQFVKQHAEKLNIKLEFQPSYSPNLNLIERVWKYIKGLVGKCHYRTKEEFFGAVSSILENMDQDQHQEKLITLLTMKFQTYKESQILGC
ncbi:transposase [Lewinella antarctica]|uniref:Transposase n=1 Tax=Neolewinella antarctica TaxID=442734 RepID=A0ABX0XFQ2_9BACT|nr:transposase [Neolewinella antarctica]